MAGDLERFLQQAAERLAQKVNQDAPVRQAKRPPPQSVRQAERRRLEPDVIDAVVLEEQRESGSDPLSTIDTRHLRISTEDRPSLAQEIGLADEKMAGHVQHVIEGDLVQLRDASQALSGASADSGATKVSRRQKEVSPFVEMLRSPQNLRAAFLASEIFKRKF